jgi:hypothetical protein
MGKDQQEEGSYNPYLSLINGLNDLLKREHIKSIEQKRERINNNILDNITSFINDVLSGKIKKTADVDETILILREKIEAYQFPNANAYNDSEKKMSTILVLLENNAPKRDFELTEKRSPNMPKAPQKEFEDIKTNYIDFNKSINLAETISKLDLLKDKSPELSAEIENFENKINHINHLMEAMKTAIDSMSKYESGRDDKRNELIQLRKTFFETPSKENWDKFVETTQIHRRRISTLFGKPTHSYEALVKALCLTPDETIESFVDKKLQLLLTTSQTPSPSNSVN